MSLEFRLNRPEPTRADVDCVVVGLFADGSLSAGGTAIDKAAGGRLSNLAKRGDLSGKTGRTAMLHDLDGVKAPRVLVVGLGESGKFGAPQFQKAVNDAVRALRTGPARSALLTLSELPVAGRDAGWAVRQAVVSADHAASAYTATRNVKNGDGGLKQAGAVPLGPVVGQHGEVRELPVRHRVAVGVGRGRQRELEGQPVERAHDRQVEGIDGSVPAVSALEKGLDPVGTLQGGHRISPARSSSRAGPPRRTRRRSDSRRRRLPRAGWCRSCARSWRSWRRGHSPACRSGP